MSGILNLRKLNEARDLKKFQNQVSFENSKMPRDEIFYIYKKLFSKMFPIFILERGGGGESTSQNINHMPYFE